MKKTFRKNALIGLLALIFMAPGPLAYIFYKHPEWLTAMGTNRGELLNPPILFKPLGDGPKWGLIVWSPLACEDKCAQEIDKLARIRLALGRHLYEVDEWLVLGEHAPELTNNIQRLLKERRVRVLHLNAAQAQTAAQLPDLAHVYIANPDDYLVLAYQGNVKPQDVYHDMKQLLKGNQGGF